MGSSKSSTDRKGTTFTMHNPKHAMARVVKSLSTRGRVTAAVASLALIGGGAAIAAASASAATPNCPNCVTFSSQIYGQGNVLNANNATNIRLRNASNTYTNEDFVVDGGTAHQVQWFVSHGWISKSSYAAVTYPFFYAVELELAPNATTNGQCIGVASAAFSGEGVTKQPCGTSAATLWVFDRDNGVGSVSDCLDAFNGGSSPSPGYCPLINGTDATFSFPEVLTATSSNSQLHVDPETKDNGTVGDTQQFTHDLSVG